MKRFILSIGILSSLCTLHAQESETTLDDALINIDLSSVESGIIYERTAQFANLYNFNREEGFDTADYDYFKQALLEMNRASNDSLFTNFKVLKDRLVKENGGIVPVGILNTDFQILNYRPEEVENGVLAYDEQSQLFTQISDRPSFYTLHTTVIAPLDIAFTGSSITYKIHQDYPFQNQNQRIEHLEADFGNGTYHNLIVDYELMQGSITIPFQEDGTKTAIYKIIYEDGTSLTTRSSIYFKYQATTETYGLSDNCAGETYKENGHITADIAFQGYALGDPKIKAEIDYRIFYSEIDGSNKLDNPILILDGFDPGDKRKIEDCDCIQDDDCSAENQEEGNFNPKLHNSMFDFQVYFDPNINDKRNALEALRQEGFDVIMINHPTYKTVDLNKTVLDSVTVDGGAYYIESNAMALIKLIKLIQYINPITKSLNPEATLKIIGPSMGGQISRYALAYLEKKEEETGDSVKWDYNVSHWVSVDSPHLGANIPLGDQALIFLLRNQSDAASDFYYKQLGSPAALQQLIEQHNSPVPAFGFSNIPYNDESEVIEEFLNAQTSLQGLSQDKGSGYFQTHYNEQFTNGLTNSLGFPTKSINLALINGSLTGSRKTTSQNEEAVNFSYADDSEKVMSIKSFARVKISLPFDGSIVFRRHIATFESHFMSSGNKERIAKFYKLPRNHITSAPNPNNRGTMDNVPGGWFPAQSDLAESIMGSRIAHITSSSTDSATFATDVIRGFHSNFFGFNVDDETILRKLNPVHSFIPSFSAIAHLEPN